MKQVKKKTKLINFWSDRLKYYASKNDNKNKERCNKHINLLSSGEQ